MIKISRNIKVIDSRMGKGKTTSMINYMNAHTHKRFIFVTPYLDEVKRIEEKCEFIQPRNRKNGGRYNSKLEHFKYLIQSGVSICTTHQLFKILDLETVNKLKEWDYILVLDEVLDVISISKLSKTEFNILEELQLIRKVNNNWIKSENEELLLKYSSDWKYSEIVKNLIRNSVEIFEDKVLVWLFPVDLLECFDITYILTFMFDGYPLKPYLELYNFNITKYSLKDYKIMNYEKDDPSDIKNLVNIVDGKINEVGKGHSAFTMYWYENILKGNTDLIIKVRKSLDNFYKNKLLKIDKMTRKETIMWTAFKDYADTITIKGIGRDNLLAHNLRATNKYGDRANVAYLVNRNYNPIIKKWLISKNLDTDDDSFALSEMIQWIWRSRIRNKKEINLFIPSERMRNLFINWLNN